MKKKKKTRLKEYQNDQSKLHNLYNHVHDCTFCAKILSHSIIKHRTLVGYWLCFSIQSLRNFVLFCFFCLFQYLSLLVIYQANKNVRERYKNQVEKYRWLLQLWDYVRFSWSQNNSWNSITCYSSRCMYNWNTFVKYIFIHLNLTFFLNQSTEYLSSFHKSSDLLTISLKDPFKLFGTSWFRLCWEKCYLQILRNASLKNTCNYFKRICCNGISW